MYNISSNYEETMVQEKDKTIKQIVNKAVNDYGL